VQSHQAGMFSKYNAKIVHSQMGSSHQTVIPSFQRELYLVQDDEAHRRLFGQCFLQVVSLIDIFQHIQFDEEFRCHYNFKPLTEDKSMALSTFQGANISRVCLKKYL
jgi:hypothetical protein